MASDGEYHYRRSTDGTLWKADINDNELECLIAKEIWYISVMDGWVYFSNETDHCLARIHSDGTDYQPLYWGQVHEPNICEDQIFFGTEAGMSRMNLDGSGQKEIISGNVWYLNVTEDMLYFCMVGENRSLCCCGLNGEGWITILPDQVYDVMVVGNQIYYTYGKDECYLYAMDKNTFLSRQINSNYTRWINTDDRFIYYTNFDGRTEEGIGYGNTLMLVSFDGTIYKQSLSDTIKGIVIEDARVYYTVLDDSVHSVMVQ